MRQPVELLRSKAALRLSVACILAGGLGACSSDTMRFAENPFSNPFQSSQHAQAVGRDPASTGSIGRAPASAVTSQPLAAPQPRLAAPQPLPAPPPASVPSPRASAPAPVTGSAQGWVPEGGTPVVLAHGETLDTLSNRYGVPKAALLSANGLTGGAQPSPGTRVIIPVYQGLASAQAPRPQPQAAQTPKPPAPHRAEPAEKPALAAKPRVEAKSAPTPKAYAEARAKAEAKARELAESRARAAADQKALGEARARFSAEARAKAEARARQEAEQKVASEGRTAEDARKRVASAPPVVQPTMPPKLLPAKPEPSPAPVDPKTTASLPKEEEAPSADFRWPARGRVIAGFAGKGGNEGINIAVPEGTPVKAAEGGVVAYAGSELKGYGNLVLIRHPNGYVSAYAHNGDIAVKRGETVKRGQVVAKSGQSGNVASPQLHFELRKGSTPVDPVPFLNN